MCEAERSRGLSGGRVREMEPGLLSLPLLDSVSRDLRKGSTDLCLEDPDLSQHSPGKSEVQAPRREATWPKSHSKLMAQLGPTPGLETKSRGQWNPGRRKDSTPCSPDSIS